MKKLLALFVLTFCFICSSQAQDKKCYYYVDSRHYNSDRVLVSSLVKATCGIYSVAIENQWHDEIETDYPEMETDIVVDGTTTVWGPFESYNEAGKDRRERMADYSRDDMRILKIHFYYYED